MQTPKPSDAACMRWWQHPLVAVAWSVGVAIVYALFPSTDTAAVIAEAVWIVGVIAWMAVGDALSVRGVR